MKVKVIASDPCWGLVVCPTIYSTDRNTVVVQGWKLTDEDKAALKLPLSEEAVEIPKSLLKSINTQEI